MLVTLCVLSSAGMASAPKEPRACLVVRSFASGLLRRRLQCHMGECGAGAVVVVKMLSHAQGSPK